MTQPVQTPFFIQAVFSATAASVLTGCSTETTGVAVGAGAVALGTVAWAGYRYLSRLRETSAAPVSTAAVLSQPSPSPSPEPEARKPFRIDFRVDVERLDRALHHPSATPAQLETALQMLCRQGLGHADEEIVQVAGATLDTAIARRGELVTHKFIALLSESLEHQANPSSGVWCCQLLFQIASTLPDKPVASHAVDVLSFVGLSHSAEDVAQKAAGSFTELAANLITPEVVNRLVTAGLKSGRGRSMARRSLEALKAISFLKGNPPTALQAFEALSIDGLLHADPDIAVMASERITEIADKDHSRITMLPLVSLRSIGLRQGAPRELTLAFLETMARIAAPLESAPGPDRRTSEKALQILFDDALTHSDPDIANISRRHLLAVYRRRPDIFSEDQRETLAMSR